MQAETRFKIKVRKDLEALRRGTKRLWFTKTQQVSLRGTPDFLMCVGGIFVAIELKRTDKLKADPLQENNINKINEAKGIGLVVGPENWKDTLQVLKILIATEDKYDNAEI